MKGLGRRIGRYLVFGLFCAASIGLTLLLLFQFPLRALYGAEYWMQDRLMEMPWARSTPVNEDFVLLGIDESSLAADTFSDEELAASRGLQLIREGYAWPRELYGLLLDKVIGEGGARLVVMDVFFEKDTGMDEPFKEALDRYADRVVIASKLEKLVANYGGVEQFKAIFPSESIVEETTPIDSRVGYVTFFREIDDRVRSLQLETTLEGINGDPAPPGSEWYRSLTGAGLVKLGRDDLLSRRDEPTPFRFTRMGPEIYKPEPIYQVFVPELWERNYGSGAAFKDKIVFIGPAATIFQDFHSGPFGKMLGVHFHMSALAAMLTEETYERAGSTTAGWLVVLMGVLAVLLVEAVSAPLRRLFVLVGAGAAYLGATILVFNRFDLLIPCMSPLVAYTSSGFLCFGYDFTLRVLENLRVRRALERFVSKDLAHEILENRDDYMSSLEGTDKEMTMLFSDIRGFTTITEELGAEELVPLLNEYLGEMVDVVFAYKGTLDKFIGDAVMAIWGSVRTEGPKGDAINAVAAAVAMHERLKAMNERWEKVGRSPFMIGVGLNSGHASFGNVGSVERMDPTVIGDAVNLAARLESLTKQYRCDTIVSESVAEFVKEKFLLRSVDRVQVKGKTKAVEIFSVIGPVVETGDTPEWLSNHEEGVRKFRDREFGAAVDLFTGVLEQLPGDFLAEMYIKNSEAFVAEPPPADWDGVTVMTSK